MIFASRKTNFSKSTLFQSGFTLIELLTVMVLIALIAGFAAISLQNDPNRIIENFSQQFVQKFELLTEESALNGTDYGLLIEDNSYRYLEWDQNTWRIPVDKIVSETVAFPELLDVDLFLEEESVLQLESEATLLDEESDDEENALPTPPQILLLSSGEVTPFSLQMETINREEYIEIKIDALGRTSVERQN